MVPLRALLVGWLLLGWSLPVFAESTPFPAGQISASPERAGRSLLAVEGLTIEFSPGDEDYVQALVRAVLEWRKSNEARIRSIVENLDPCPPMSATDLGKNQEVYLASIARWIGLPEPTALQRQCYRTMLASYELAEATRFAGVEFARHAVTLNRFAVWRRAELVRRLEAGEQIPGMSWDAKTRTGNYNFSYNFDLPADPAAKQIVQDVERQRLTHSFNYTVDKDGVAHVKASFTLKPQGGVPEFKTHLSDARLEELKERIRTEMPHRFDFVVPAVIPEVPSSPEEVAKKTVDMVDGVIRSSAGLANFRDGALALVVLHEATELGIVETYIGSKDRRWLCDGVAHFVACQIARQAAGEEFARKAYDVDAQLRRHAALQPKIDLLGWTSVENESPGKVDSALADAHYAFATRAVHLMVQRHGEDVLPKLFREIGKTPRQQVTMKTVRKAYEKVTRSRLEPLIHEAESAPLPPPPAPPRRNP